MKTNRLIIAGLVLTGSMALTACDTSTHNPVVQAPSTTSTTRCWTEYNYEQKDVEGICGDTNKINPETFDDWGLPANATQGGGEGSHPSTITVAPKSNKKVETSSTVIHCAEDDPCWDADTMGNKSYGPGWNCNTMGDKICEGK